MTRSIADTFTLNSEVTVQSNITKKGKNQEEQHGIICFWSFGQANRIDRLTKVMSGRLCFLCFFIMTTAEE